TIASARADARSSSRSRQARPVAERSTPRKWRVLTRGLTARFMNSLRIRSRFSLTARAQRSKRRCSRLCISLRPPSRQEKHNCPCHHGKLPRPKIDQLENDGIFRKVAGHQRGRVLTHHPYQFVGFFGAAAVLLAMLGAPAAQAQLRGIQTPSIGPVGPINPGSITSGVGSGASSAVGSISSGVGAVSPVNPGIGSFPGNTDLSVSGTVGIITNAVPIEGLYDRATNTVTNTLTRTTSGNPKDPLGKGTPGAQPR